MKLTKICYIFITVVVAVSHFFIIKTAQINSAANLKDTVFVKLSTQDEALGDGVGGGLFTDEYRPFPLQLITLSSTLKNLYEEAETRFLDIDVSEEHKSILEKYFFGWQNELLQNDSAALHTKLRSLPISELVKIADVLVRYYDVEKFQYVEDLLDNGACHFLSVRSMTCNKTLSSATDRINSIAYSPNGDQIAGSSRDFDIKIWDCATNNLLHTLIGHTKRITSIVYNPKDNHQLASSSHDGTVKIWNCLTGQLLHTLSDHTNDINAVIYSPDGSQLASLSQDRTIKLWDSISGKLLHTLPGCIAWAHFAEYSPDGKQIIAVSNDILSIKIWDCATGKLLRTLDTTETSYLTGNVKGYFITSIICNPKSNQIIATLQDGSISIWNSSTGKLLKTLMGDNDSIFTNRVIYSPNGSQIAYTSGNGTIKIWDVSTYGLLYLLSSGAIRITELKYNNENQLTAALDNGAGGIIKTWDCLTGNSLSTIPTGQANHIISIQYNPKGSQIASLLADGTVKMCSAPKNCPMFNPEQKALLGFAMTFRRNFPQKEKTLENILSTISSDQKDITFYKNIYNSLTEDKKILIDPLIQHIKSVEQSQNAKPEDYYLKKIIGAIRYLNFYH